MSTTRDTPERQMKETLFSRHHNTLDRIMFVEDRKTALKALYTDVLNKAVNSHERNAVLDHRRPPPINNSEKDPTTKERTTLAQLLWTPQDASIS